MSSMGATLAIVIAVGTGAVVAGSLLFHSRRKSTLGAPAATNASSAETAASPIWAVAANIVEERKCGPGGADTRRGTKHFRPGAKVFVVDLFPGMCENVVIIGQHRRSRRYVKMVIRAEWLENLRPQLVYSPTVVRLVKAGHTRLDHARAVEMHRAISLWQKAQA